jgi:hypothetical protein
LAEGLAGTLAASSTGEGLMSEWTTETVDNIEKVVGAVRDRTVRPAQNVTKAVVFGLLTTFFIVTALALLAIGAFRVVDVYLPAGVWATYLIFGGIFVVGGTFCWAQRMRAPPTHPGGAEGT